MYNWRVSYFSINYEKTSIMATKNLIEVDFRQGSALRYKFGPKVNERH